MHEDISTTVLGLHGHGPALGLPHSSTYIFTDPNSNLNTNTISNAYSLHSESDPSSHSQSVAQSHPGSNDCGTHCPHLVVSDVCVHWHAECSDHARL